MECRELRKSLEGRLKQSTANWFMLKMKKTTEMAAGRRRSYYLIQHYGFSILALAYYVVRNSQEDV